MPKKTHPYTLYNQEVHNIHVSDTARAAGVASPELIAEALTYLHRDGILILENAIETSHLDALNDVLAPEAFEIAKNPNHHFNFGRQTRNMDQAPPLNPELMFQDVWANPVACEIVKAILGPEIVCHYANGNTALKANGRQPVHSDIEKPHPAFPFAYLINIPLCDLSIQNGSTEVWLGSHHESCADQHVVYDGERVLHIKPELVEQRRQHSPPTNPCSKKGSLIIRDIRLWHAGIPNRTANPRIMLAFVIQPKWFKAPSRVLLPLKARGLVDQWRANTGLEYHAEWVDGDVDHKTVRSTDVDFSTNNSKMLELEELMRPPSLASTARRNDP